MSKKVQADLQKSFSSGAHSASGPSEVFVAMHDQEENAKYNFPTNYIQTAKYNVATFFFMNLLVQFRKVSNFYFLINMIFALVPDVSPVSPYTAVAPLVIVVGVAMFKDGYEDVQRHKSDNKANSMKAQVVRDGRLQQLESKEIRVGDIMKIELGEEIRADMLLLSSCLPDGAGYIDTCNLDGETNLKGKKAHQVTWDLDTPEKLQATKLRLKTGPPDPGLLRWGGVMTVDGQEVSVGLDQFLYRSSVLRNTDWCWAMVIYAGVDTKMFRNLQKKPPKMSSLDYKLNNLIIGILIVQHVLLFLMAGLAVAFNNDKEDTHWYMEWFIKDLSGFALWGYRYMSFFILMSYLVPISLFVTIEICKVLQAQMMKYDHEMFSYMNDKWVGCTPNTSDLNEQLSQVRYIFSDKTGTLTENVMNYLQGDILGLPIDASRWEMSEAYVAEGSPHRERALEYWRALAVCHTIQPFEDRKHPGHVIYEGASPDEVALVRAAVHNKMVLTARTLRYLTVNEERVERKYDILATLEFTPDRKMMSIILREPSGDIVLYTKGADTFVIPNMANNAHNNEYLPKCRKNLGTLAELGLRTLIVCKKKITQSEFDAWFERFTEVGKILENRAQLVDEVCLQMEKDLDLVGATAIEDKLQDKVPETLQHFLDAGVVIWMLTGDKRETAVTIAATSQLMNPQKDNIIHADIGDRDPEDAESQQIVGQQLQEALHATQNTRGQRTTIVIDGSALKTAQLYHFDLFLEVSQRLASAVCCRLTPLQKASVVKMFQATGATALAIGDGANDVSMIQEGRVGVGIMGLEGAQAQLAADYAIPRFKHLRRLCMVHGRYSLYRNSFCVLYSFYKNVIIAMMQCYFCFFTGYSAMALSDTSGWLLSFYNFAFTSLPPLFIGMFEKDLPEHALMKDPTLYKPLAQGLYFDVKSTCMWFGESILHSLCLFFIMFPTYQRSELKDGKIADVYMISTVVISATVCLVLGRIAVGVRYWIVLHVGSISFSLFLYFAFLLLYSAIPMLFGDTHFYFTAYILMADPKFWLSVLLLSVGLLMPLDIAGIHLQKALFPTSRDIAQLQYAESSEDARIALQRSMSEITQRKKEQKLKEQSSSGFK